MKEIIRKLVSDYNTYAKLVALNYQHQKEGECEEVTLQWNRGNLNCIEKYLDALAEKLGIEVTYIYGDFGHDGWKRTLTYAKAEIRLAEWDKIAD